MLTPRTGYDQAGQFEDSFWWRERMKGTWHHHGWKRQAALLVSKWKLNGTERVFSVGRLKITCLAQKDPYGILSAYLRLMVREKAMWPKDKPYTVRGRKH